MHGLGNDFVIVKRTPYLTRINEKDLAVAISNRRTGVGCDQFIIYDDNTGEQNTYNMSIYNSDGSSAEACGNGTRCLVKLIGLENIKIKIFNRILEARNLPGVDVCVNMGSVSFNENWMPGEEILWEIAAHYKLEPKEVVCADIGNPHLVIFNSDLAYKDTELLGKVLEKHPAFVNGVNVNFARIVGNDIELKVWERGDGFTLACGSGACVTFASAKKLGFVNSKAKVRFSLGCLNMNMENNSIFMTGPAIIVASGNYLYE